MQVAACLSRLAKTLRPIIGMHVCAAMGLVDAAGCRGTSETRNRPLLRLMRGQCKTTVCFRLYVIRSSDPERNLGRQRTSSITKNGRPVSGLAASAGSQSDGQPAVMLFAFAWMVKTVSLLSSRTPAVLSTPFGDDAMTVIWPPFGNVGFPLTIKVTELVDWLYAAVKLTFFMTRFLTDVSS